MILGAQKERLVMVLAKLLRTSPKEVQNYQLEIAGSEKQLSGLQRGLRAVLTLIFLWLPGFHLSHSRHKFRNTPIP